MSWVKDNEARAKRIAKIREDLHLNHASHRPLSDRYEEIGVYGEMKFEEITGWPMDEEGHIQGDRGIDFMTCWRFIDGENAGPIDVKTARNPKNLIIEIGKCYKDLIYVLALFTEEDVTMLGWEYGSEMITRPTKDFGYGVINHYKPRGQLRPMESLYDQLEMIGLRP